MKKKKKPCGREHDRLRRRACRAAGCARWRGGGSRLKAGAVAVVREGRGGGAGAGDELSLSELSGGCVGGREGAERRSKRGL